MLYINVVDRIEDMIFTDRVKPGDRLPGERELAKRFSVSRTVIREAIKNLEQKGFVRVQPGKGVFITEPQKQLVTESIQRILGQNKITMEQLVEAREVLETSIIQYSSQRINDEQVVHLEKIVEQLDLSLQDIKQFLMLDNQFHLEVVKSAGNPIYLIFMNSILELIHAQREQMIFHSPRSMERGQTHHKKIVAALKERNKEKSVQAIRGHMKQIREDIDAFKEMGFI
ncbi:FadR/GntR family transcriptional regulator [Ferviditalea candida]|uniref:FadR/GntR family transcriptional regulator n=1 Tax=Ferviditalea candida TaxID=3108399 RepID=A0ABU5ZID8_9BACL|nr:FadR/GntR family transcriptional regulator [Paenibacillaceae bacterium T2]